MTPLVCDTERRSRSDHASCRSSLASRYQRQLLSNWSVSHRRIQRLSANAVGRTHRSRLGLVTPDRNQAPSEWGAVLRTRAARGGRRGRDPAACGRSYCSRRRLTRGGRRGPGRCIPAVGFAGRPSANRHRRVERRCHTGHCHRRTGFAGGSERSFQGGGGRGRLRAKGACRMIAHVGRAPDSDLPPTSSSQAARHSILGHPRSPFAVK